jgi:polyhydroxybutyrate depolymerase
MNKQNKFFLFILVFALFPITTVKAQAFTVAVFPNKRQFQVDVPADYSAKSSYPLIIALPGYQQSSEKFEAHWKFSTLVDQLNFIYVVADGTLDKYKNQFWNGAGCCDSDQVKTNDDSYIISIIASIQQQYQIDPSRIYLLGHSNGGFMVNELACNHAKLFAAVVDYAGGNYPDLNKCQPNSALNYLEVWGSKDETFYGNHELGRKILGAVPLVQFWGQQNKCVGQPTKTEIKADYDLMASQKEVVKLTFQGCANQVDTQLWEVVGSNHLPTPTEQLRLDLINFLLEHQKNI